MKRNQIINLINETLTKFKTTTMKTNIPQQIIVPVYYHVENGEVQFDFEQMTEFFENELSNIKY